MKNAADLKEKGNKLFKSGRLTEAVKCYSEAETLAPQEAVYPSNLSATLYELGDYKGSYEAVCRSGRLLTEQELESPLSTRLSIRLAKSLRYGVRSGSITSEDVIKGADVVDTLRSLVCNVGDESSSSLIEARRVWDEWRNVEAEMRRIALEGDEARKRLARLPIFRQTAESDSQREFYSVGNDEVINIVEDWGPESVYEGSDDPLPLNDLPLSCLQPLALVFGGVGDARHVFGSLIGLQKAHAKLDEQRKDLFKAHMTLIDIHPTALARDLCLFMLLEELMNGSVGEEDAIVIKATLFYSYLGVLMPIYCYTKWIDAVKDLRIRLAASPPSLPSWFHVLPESIPGIISSLKYWETSLGKKTVKGSLAMHNVPRGPSHIENTVPALRHQMEKKKAEDRNWIKSQLDTYSEADVIGLGTNLAGHEPCPPDPVGKKKWLAETRKLLIDLMTDDNLGSIDTKPEMLKEDWFYRQSKIFVPHPMLWHRHEALEEIWTRFRDLKREEGPAADELRNKFAASMAKTIKPNPSLFDRSQGATYPDMNVDPFKAVKEISNFNIRMGLVGDRDSVEGDVDKNYPSFSVGEVFFDNVVTALRALEGHVVLEVIHDDLSAALSKIRVGAEARPAEFPRKFMRMWLSNVPDYTHGPMNTAVFSMPALEVQPGANATANCLLNTGCWNGGEEFFHFYTLLRIVDAPRFLGCEVVNMTPAWGLITLTPQQLPRPLSELATRDELYTWLSRTLVCILVPGHPSRESFRCRYPNNLVSFVSLLIHLHNVGFPSHWLSEYLQVLISDNLTTDVAPYRGELPIPVTELNRRVPKRKINLEPWLIDFENILATAYEAFPFPVSLRHPSFATSHTEIGTFEAHLSREEFDLMTTMKILSPLDPVVSLLFFKPVANVDPNELIRQVPHILEGKRGTGPAKGQMCVLTSLERCEISTGLVRWRMSRERVAKMKANGWNMIGYRFDRESSVTNPIPSSRWTEIQV